MYSGQRNPNALEMIDEWERKGNRLNREEELQIRKGMHQRKNDIHSMRLYNVSRIHSWQSVYNFFFGIKAMLIASMVILIPCAIIGWDEAGFELIWKMALIYSPFHFICFLLKEKMNSIRVENDILLNEHAQLCDYLNPKTYTR